MSARPAPGRAAARDILTFTGVVVDRSGRFTPANARPDRLLLPAAVRDEFDVNATAEVETFHPDLTTIIPEWIQTKTLPKDYSGNPLDLTAAHIADIDASIKNLIKYGREVLTALTDGTENRLSDLRDKLLATMDTLPARRILHPREKKRDSVQAELEDYFYGNLNIDALSAEVDGFASHKGRGTGLMQRLIDRVRDGEVKQMELLASFQTNTAGAFRTLDRMLYQ